MFKAIMVRWGALALGLVLIVPMQACGAFRRGPMGSSTLVQVSSGERDIATLRRTDYDLLAPSVGEASTTRWFLLWFPVGNASSSEELEANAAFEAVTAVKGCDEVLLPHTKSRRFIIPLLVVTVVVKRVMLRGRCISLRASGS